MLVYNKTKQSRDKRVSLGDVSTVRMELRPASDLMLR